LALAAGTQIGRSAKLCGVIIATSSPARAALKNSQVTRQAPGERHAYFGDGTPGAAS